VVHRLEAGQRLDLLALELERRGLADGGGQHDGEDFHRLTVVLVEPVGVRRADDVERAHGAAPVEERQADQRLFADLARMRWSMRGSVSASSMRIGWPVAIAWDATLAPRGRRTPMVGAAIPAPARVTS
jgi:hypothetical protein